MSLDSSLSALVADYRRDPHRQLAVERKFRIMDTSLEFANAEFQQVGRKGQTVEVENEPFVKVAGYDGYAASTAQNLLSSKQQFTIDEAAKWDVRLYDVDEIQTEDDLNNLVLNSATYQAARYMTGIRFAAIKAASPLQLSEIDISNATTPGTPDPRLQAHGDLVFNALDEATEALRSQGMPDVDLKAALPSLCVSALRYSQYIQNSTEGANSVNQKGMVGALNNTRLFSSIDTPKTNVNYTAVVNGAVAVGDHVITVDGVVDGAVTPIAVTPLVGDTFTNASETYTVVAVTATTTSGEFQLFLDRPVEDIIADNASLTVSGYTHQHIIFASGKPLSSVVQSNFTLKVNESEEDTFSARLKGMTLFDNFMTTEQRRRCVIVPVKVRDYTSV